MLEVILLTPKSCCIKVLHGKIKIKSKEYMEQMTMVVIVYVKDWHWRTSK
jgi:hypothetical protein